MWKLTCALLLLQMLAISPSAQTVGSAQTATPSANQQPMRVRVNQGVLKPLRKVSPVYPEAARNAGIQGSVVLNVLIGTDGRVKKLEPVSGDPALVQSAVEAVELWTYQPLTINGAPVEVDTQVDVKFRHQ